MRLMTHNMLKCNVKGIDNGYPLIIESNNTEIVTYEYNSELIKKIILKINFNALQSAANNLQITSEFTNISEVSDELLSNESFLKYVNHLLFELHVLEGFLVCPVSGRKVIIIIIICCCCCCCFCCCHSIIIIIIIIICCCYCYNN